MFDGTTFSAGTLTIDTNTGSITTGGGSIRTNGGLISSDGGNILTSGGNLDMTGGGDINGSGANILRDFKELNAAIKNFDIEHPTKKDPYRLRYSVLEGPEVGVFVRGENKDTKIIELPYYWNDLIFEKSLSVNLTPIGSPTIYYVEKIENNKIYIGSNSEEVHYYYTVFAERKDVDKLIVEYTKKD